MGLTVVFLRPRLPDRGERGFFVGKVKRMAAVKLSRRLITLIYAGRNRRVMIRRELPLTRNADWAVRPCHKKLRKPVVPISRLCLPAVLLQFRSQEYQSSRSARKCYTTICSQCRRPAAGYNPVTGGDSWSSFLSGAFLSISAKAIRSSACFQNSVHLFHIFHSFFC